jgi:hypothetical protein
MKVMNKQIWPYQIKMHIHPNRRYVTDDDPRRIWCYDKLNDSDWTSYGYSNVVYCFKKECDAVLFALHWL